MPDLDRKAVYGLAQRALEVAAQGFFERPARRGLEALLRRGRGVPGVEGREALAVPRPGDSAVLPEPLEPFALEAHVADLGMVVDPPDAWNGAALKARELEHRHGPSPAPAGPRGRLRPAAREGRRNDRCRASPCPCSRARRRRTGRGELPTRGSRGCPASRPIRRRSRAGRARRVRPSRPRAETAREKTAPRDLDARRS